MEGYDYETKKGQPMPDLANQSRVGISPRAIRELFAHIETE